MRRPSYANVVSTLALFLALGGTGYAAVQFTGKNIKDGSLTGADVKDGSLEARDLQGGVPGAATGPAGPQGASGLQGAAGPQGSSGAPGAAGPGGPAGSAGLRGEMGNQGPAGGQGPAGLKGDAGAQGSAGPKGDAGPPGATVAARVRAAAEQTTAANTTAGSCCGGNTTSIAGPPNQSVALSGASWNQQADELQQLVGRAVVQIPATCTTANTQPSAGSPTFFGDIELDGVKVGSLAPVSVGTGPGTTVARAVTFSVPALFEPGNPVTHTMSLKISDGCDGDASGHFVLKSFQVDVMGAQ